MTSAPVVVTGVDRVRGRWVAVTLAIDHRRDVRLHGWTLADRFTEVADPGSTILAIDIPIGLTQQGSRTPDHEARRVLPGWARSRVFITPPRPVLRQVDALDNDAIQQLCRTLTGSGVSRQALALAPAIFDVEDALLADSTLPDRTIEVHPELSFAMMSGKPALASKKTAVGVAHRIASLSAAWPLDVITAMERVPKGVPVDDSLDALAVAWSGWRHTTGEAHSLPPPPHPVDARGLRMAITV